MRRLVIDTANILFRVSSANGKNFSANPADAAGLAMHSALNTLRSFYNKYKPDQVAVTFEGGQNWRKAHTRGERPETAVSKRLYKGNRIKDDSMIPYFELMDAFKTLAIEHTSLVVLHNPILEGDDCFSGYTRKFSAAGDEVIGLSDDKDFVTLLQLPNVKLFRPDGTQRGLDKTGQKIDPKFFMYEKAFRGDSGDNVMPAFPKVRSTKLKAAYDALQKGDTFLHSNLMNETWTFYEPSSGEPVKFRVGDLYDENVLLMDLINGQPKDIQDEIEKTIDAAILNHGSFNMFAFQRFCGKFNLKKIGDDVSAFIPLLSSSGIGATKPKTSGVMPKKAPPRKGILQF